MQNTKIPFNISLLELTPQTLANIKPVSSLDWFDGSSKNFHEEGLFSVSIFGKIGDERRNRTFSYIDIRVEIFHPIVYRTLVKLKALYGEIMASKTYAKWNNEIKDFEKSTMLEGETGYHFFVKHYKKIVFEKTDSVSRDLSIKMLQKYKDKTMLDKIVVMPAGLRDLEMQPDGRFSEDEINELYRKIISLSKGITIDALENSPETIDSTRLNIQYTFNQIFTLIENMLQGKSKLIMGKWASRKVYNGTRNVITSIPIKNTRLDDEANITSNHTVVGLYQYLKASLPVSLYDLKNGFLSKVFTGPNDAVNLVNKKTLKGVSIRLKPEYYDSWFTNDGLEKIINQYAEEGVRHQRLEIADHYMGLIYKGEDGSFRMMKSIDELPVGADPKRVSPLTFCELLYLSVYKSAKRLYGFVTRYPITGMGSIYPSKLYLKTTVESEKRFEIDENGQKIEGSFCYGFPVQGQDHVNSLSPHHTRLARLGADFDGDTCSLNVVYSDEAIEELDNYLNSAKFYVSFAGEMNFSAQTDTISYVLLNMTK